MKHVEPDELFGEQLDRDAKRPGIFKRLVLAIHLSRRRQARSLIRSYRHLLADDAWNREPGALLDVRKK